MEANGANAEQGPAQRGENARVEVTTVPILYWPGRGHRPPESLRPPGMPELAKAPDGPKVVLKSTYDGAGARAVRDELDRIAKAHPAGTAP